MTHGGDGASFGDMAHRFRRDGFVAPVAAIRPEETQAILNEIALLRRQLGGEAETILRHKPHLVLPSFAGLIRDHRVTDAVAALLGPDLLCWTTNLFAKTPGDGMRVSWHQDGTYWGLSSADVVTAWVALSPSTPENGCLRVIPGSHTWPQQQHRDTYAPDNLLTRGQEIAVEVDESEAVDIVLGPGEMSLHHVMIAHASEPNRGAVPRLGVAIRYISTAVEQTSGMTDSASLARGQDRHGHFEAEPAPVALADHAAREAHRQSMERTQRLLHRQTRM
ncbi:MAG: phytanoyl-CoA dioxygenase family protein [Parvibaculaceae bacterium]